MYNFGDSVRRQAELNPMKLASNQASNLREDSTQLFAHSVL